MSEEKSKWNSRKFFTMAASLFLASVFLAWGKISGAEWIIVFGGTVGVYLPAQSILDGLKKQ